MKRLTVPLENRPGAVAELTAALAARQVNIDTLDVEGLATNGVANLTVDQYDVALQALRDAGFRAVSEDALVLRLVDEPGALARVATRFKDAQINIRSMHILKRQARHTLVTIVCDRPAEAMALVRDVLVSGT